MKKHSTPFKSFLATSLFLIICLYSSSQTITWYQDLDGDGWGNPATSTSSSGQPTGYVLNKLDCDDNRVNTTAWSDLGPQELSDYGVYSTSLVVDSANTPYLVYVDSLSNKAIVKKYDGINWISLGEVGAVSIYTIRPIIGIYNGIPYVAYRDANNSNKITVKKYDGTNWQLVGNAGFSGATTGSAIDMAIDATGKVYVIYIESSNSKGTVMKYDGTNWTIVGTTGFINPVGLSITLDQMGTPYIAFGDRDVANKSTTVMKFDGTNWILVGTAGFSNGSTLGTDIAIDATGMPYVFSMFTLNDLGGNVMKFDGTDWAILDTAITEGHISRFSIAVDATGTAYVTYIRTAYNNSAVVKKYNGMHWIAIDSANFAPNNLNCIFLTLDVGGVPIVAYANSDNLNKQMVIKLAPQLLNSSLIISSTTTDSNVIYTAHAIGGGNSPVYKWYKNEVLINGATASTYTTKMMSLSDTISCVMTSNDACVDTTILAYSNKIGGILVTGMEEASSLSQNHITIYPIPAKDVLNIQLDNSSNETVVICIYDITGKEVINNSYVLKQARETVVLAINGINAGAYFVKVRLNNLSTFKKFIKN